MFYQSKTTNIFFTLLFAILFFVLGFAKLGFAEPNRVPVIDTKNWIPAQTLDLLGGARTFDLSWRFSDPDGDTLTYSSDSNHPDIVTVSVSNATLTITPVAVGQATIMVRATDPHHAEAGIAVLVNVVQSGAPVTVGSIPDQTLTVDGGSVTVDVSSYFSDPDSDALHYTFSLSDPSKINASVAGASVTFTPVEAGTSTVTVTATDPGGLTATQTFSITIKNSAPMTVGSIPDQTLTVDGGSVTVDVSSYFSDPDGDTLSYAFSFSDPSKINTSVAGATVTFTPVAVGTSTVTVTATDPSNLSATQTFSVTVGEASNRAPVILATIPDQTLSIGETFTVNPKTYFSDPDGDTLDHLFFPTITPTVRLDIGPNGEGIFTALAAGTVEASVGVEDPGNLRVSQTFSITVIGAANNQPQPVGTIPAQTLTVGGGSATVDVSSYFSDPDGDALSYSFSYSDSSKINANVAGSTVIFAPIAAGSSTVTVTATDPDGLTATQTFTITVNKASNRAPVTAGSIPDQTLTVGGTAVSVDVSGYFSDPDGDALRYSSISGDPDIATVSVSGTTVTITPVAIGTTSVTVTASDQHLQESSSISVNVVGNLAPVTLGTISDQTLSIGETFTVNPNNYFRDPDGDTLTYTYHSSDTHIVGMTIDLRGGTFTANAVGTVTVRITAMDPSGLKTSANFSITVAGAPNASPQAVGSIPDQTLTVGGTSVSVDVSSYFSDPDGDALSYSFSFSDASRVNAVITGSTATLNPVAAGTITATAIATDPGSLTATQTFTITVNKVSNRAPVTAGSIPDQTLTVGGTSASVDVSSYFSDPDGDALSYSFSFSDASRVNAVITGSTATLNPVAAGTITATATATDPGGLTATQSFSVRVDVPSNRAPVAVGSIPDQTLTVGGTAVSIDMSSYFSDPDGDALSYSFSFSDASKVNAVVTGSTATLNPVAAGTITATATATDPGGLTATQTFTITVNKASNRAPVAVGSIPDQTLTVGGTAVSVDVSGYFSDPDGDALRYSSISGDPEIATASVAGSTVTITPVAVGTTWITVTASDQHLQESTNISVSVVGNLAPVTLGTISDQTLSIGETFTVNPNNYFRDPDGDTLTYTYHSSDTHIVGMTIDPRGGTFTANAAGTATVRITAMDPSGLKTSVNFSITVAGAPNASPQAVGSIPDQTLTVGGTSVSIDVSSYFSDPDRDALSYSFSFSDASRVNAVVTGSTATLNPVAAGTITATATATDPSGLTATQSFSVTVNEPSNRAPVAVGSIPNQTLTIGDSGTTVDVSSHFSDADNDTLTYTASSSDTTKATVSVSNATVSIAAVAAGTVTITVTATDPGSLTATQIFSMTASHPNRAPAAVGTIPNQTVAIGGASVTLNLSSYFSDPDSDALTYTASISDEPVLPEPLVKMGVSNTLQTLSITAGQTEGRGTITVTATDTGNLSVAQAFALTVIQPNRAPAKSSKGEIPKQYIDSTAPVRVIGIDSYFTDPDGDTLTYTAASSDTTVATASVSRTTVSVSRVTAASSGEITITVTATDPSGLSATRTFSVTVDPDPPNVSSNGSPEAIKLDINDDGIINILDLVLVANQIGQPATGNIADVNADGVINILDLVLVANEL